VTSASWPIRRDGRKAEACQLTSGARTRLAVPRGPSDPPRSHAISAPPAKSTAGIPGAGPNCAQFIDVVHPASAKVAPTQSKKKTRDRCCMTTSQLRSLVATFRRRRPSPRSNVWATPFLRGVTLVLRAIRLLRSTRFGGPEAGRPERIRARPGPCSTKATPVGGARLMRDDRKRRDTRDTDHPTADISQVPHRDLQCRDWPKTTECQPPGRTGPTYTPSPVTLAMARRGRPLRKYRASDELPRANTIT
jgi:hypothetical protein